MDIRKFILENRTYFEDFVTIATYKSNRLEGNTLTLDDTYAIIFNKDDVKITATARHLYEVINHKYALNYVITQMTDDYLLEQDIKNLGIMINKNINEISGYRTTPAFILGAEHIPPKPVDVPSLMMYMVHEYNHDTELDVFEKMAKYHIQYERIHPFGDGNGRTGRLLLCYECLLHDIAPIMVDKDNASKYYEFLANQNVDELASMFKELSEQEQQRMDLFVPEINVQNINDMER